MAGRNTFISKAEYAARIGVHRSQISRYVKAGMPTHNGLVEPDEADRWRQANLDPTKPKSKVQVPSEPEPSASAKRQVAPSKRPLITAPPGEASELIAARARDAHYSAELRRRKLLEFDREHISRAEVEAAWDAANTMYRQGLEGIAGRTASIIAGLTGGEAARIEEIIRDEHRAVLSAVADLFDKAAVLAEAGGAPPEGGEDGAPAEEAPHG
ncbi:hypothetical protein FZ983_17025 [Azospirillum sp. B21]|uniref:hypothetical protein n=1 Tax=Azospirillum sp. B21 TaxID=2607496 RepID=UPI0011EFB72A|nr:hypothetical protein [Azospirillum sp. B21]KAA0579027.1 hypothetical protein FZ983_17025 [Azospirillum sp. B21]